jgi:hypothetical protein
MGLGYWDESRYPRGCIMIIMSLLHGSAGQTTWKEFETIDLKLGPAKHDRKVYNRMRNQQLNVACLCHNRC